jgi:hypothetical protein
MILYVTTPLFALSVSYLVNGRTYEELSTIA